jgi:(E)-4-hydroxy-3-methylbut-2-enyl-diphosphate synthase
MEGGNHKRRTRAVRIGGLQIGAGAPVAVQSMCATKTRDIDATVAQTQQLQRAGAAIVRIAVDNAKEVDALREIRRQTDAVLAVDLQENYRLASTVGPCVDKIRQDPLQPWPSASRRARQVDPRQGRLAGGRGTRHRLRHPHWCELWLGGA